MKRKKKYGVVVISILLLVVAVTLLTYKASYSSPIGNPSCPTNVKLSVSDETLTLIKTDYETITLPKEVYTTEEDGTLYDNVGLLLHRNSNVYSDFSKVENLTEDLMKLIPDVSTDEYQNRYYRQLILWWLLDMYAGYEDNYNYIDGEEVAIESDSNEKYDSDGFYIYDNLLSALEKRAIKESEKGKIVLNTLENIQNYLEWIETEEGQNTTDPELYLNPIDTSKIKLQVTNSYIETNLITPTSVEDYAIGFTNYKVVVGSPITVVDENGNERTDFKNMEGFKLRIPFSEVKNGKIQFKFTIQGITRDQQTFTYMPIQQVWDYGNYAYPGVFVNCHGDYEDENIFVPLETNYEVAGGNVNIKVINSSTREYLPGAEITIYNEQGDIVYRQTTTEDEINIVLPAGNYTIRQTVTPPNYEATVIEQQVQIIQNREASVVLENVPLVSVPDTSMTSGYIPLIGFVVLIIGILILGVMIKNKKHE